MSKDEQVKNKGEKLNIPIIKYFWQASPIAGGKKDSIHKFLRNVSVFDHFSDYELYLFTRYLHLRNFASKETIFKEGDGGFAFYIILDGLVDIYTSNLSASSDDELNYITQLSKFNYFGELALLEQQNKRNATAVCAKSTTLLTIFKPDLDELIERNPVVGAKLLQGLSTIVSKRLNGIAHELKQTKEKLQKLEENANKEL